MEDTHEIALTKHSLVSSCDRPLSRGCSGLEKTIYSVEPLARFVTYKEQRFHDGNGNSCTSVKGVQEILGKVVMRYY